MKLLCLYITIALVTISCKAQNIIAKGAELTLVANEFEFTEGPAVDKNGDIYFTDQPNDRIVKWSAKDNTVANWMKPSGRSNGLFFDNNGNLISCADEKNELWSIDPQKNITVLIDNYKGKKLGGPNDVWVAANGGMFITDPFYPRPWWDHIEAEINERRLYYLAPGSKELSIADRDFVMPNGIIGTPDGKNLYVSDIKGNKTYVFILQEDGSLTDRKIFCELGSDGMTIDNRGNVYLTGNGVTVFDKKGNQIEHIKIPEKWTANITFAGPKQDILFITAMDAVYTLKMKVHGVR